MGNYTLEFKTDSLAARRIFDEAVEQYMRGIWEGTGDPNTFSGLADLINTEDKMAVYVVYLVHKETLELYVHETVSASKEAAIVKAYAELGDEADGIDSYKIWTECKFNL